MTGIVVLAAGESSRLGQPKQLLPWRSTTLLRHAAQEALNAELGPVIVVLGSSAEACRAEIGVLPVQIVINLQWKDGMGRSIAEGMKAFASDAVDSVIVMLCDQPMVGTPLLKALDAELRRGESSIVATRRGTVLGPPAIFGYDWLASLRQLRGREGAKDIIAKGANVAELLYEDASFDVDTPADVRLLRELADDQRHVGLPRDIPQGCTNDFPRIRTVQKNEREI